MPVSLKILQEKYLTLWEGTEDDAVWDQLEREEIIHKWNHRLRANWCAPVSIFEVREISAGATAEINELLNLLPYTRIGHDIADRIQWFNPAIAVTVEEQGTYYRGPVKWLIVQYNKFYFLTKCRQWHPREYPVSLIWLRNFVPSV